MKMSRYYTDRETYGPDFDDRLIQLVRENPAIYDVSHPHYRRNPIRVAIWDRIASELGASSRFLQTKWKNIRYNYLQEIKCLETGHPNVNVRKRRFTEDLSFLQKTAQTYNMRKGGGSAPKANSTYNSSDNDSNSYMYPDVACGPNAFEVIEIEHSDEEEPTEESMKTMGEHQDASACLAPTNGVAAEHNELYNQPDNDPGLDKHKEKEIEFKPEVTIEKHKLRRRDGKDPKNQCNTTSARPRSPAPSCPSNPSSPLLMPIISHISNGVGFSKNEGSGSNSTNGGYSNELTIEYAQGQKQRYSNSIPPDQIMQNAAKRKAMQAPLPVLTPINDPIELYCLSLVDSLRSMPRSERERVKFEFAKILKDATYKDQS